MQWDSIVVRSLKSNLDTDISKQILNLKLQDFQSLLLDYWLTNENLTPFYASVKNFLDLRLKYGKNWLK